MSGVAEAVYAWLDGLGIPYRRAEHAPAPTMEDCAKMVSQGLYLCQWDDAEKSPDGKLHTAWAYIHQLDVRHRYEGAYIEKPAFWTEE